MSQDTEQFQQSPREIAKACLYEATIGENLCGSVSAEYVLERIEKSLAAKDREIAELRERLEQRDVQLAGCDVAALGGTKDPAQSGSYGWSASYASVLELRLKYEVLQEENTKLKKPPPIESWKDLVRLAYKEDPDNGALRINQITGHYNAMEKQRDALAEALGDASETVRKILLHAQLQHFSLPDTPELDPQGWGELLASVDELKQQEPTK